SMIDTNKGYKELFSEIESTKPKNLPDSVPESWTKDDATSDFILKWFDLEPKLSDKDLRASIYLSRETMPAAHYVIGLSPKARDALSVLITTTRKSSQAAVTALRDISQDEFVPVMESLIEHLRTITEWSKQPAGFAGAVLVADKHIEAGKVFKRFISGINDNPHWMNALIKEKKWFK
ncbi:KAP family P-loop domain protein, partial [Cronobacter sakazakii]|nr:KAP family P-loop domain protein [Cronobacter sakazakii]EIZ9611288.1 KAP family P-loop domain protein [Cronobacter sakazakii]